MSERTYKCPKCGHQVTLGPNETIPFCCGEPMVAEPLPYCTTASTAEMARPGGADEPCDDGTSKKGGL